MGYIPKKENLESLLFSFCSRVASQNKSEQGYATKETEYHFERSAGKCHKNTSKIWIATRSWIGNQLLYNKTAVELPIRKLGLPNFRWSLYFT